MIQKVMKLIKFMFKPITKVVEWIRNEKELYDLKYELIDAKNTITMYEKEFNQAIEFNRQILNNIQIEHTQFLDDMNVMYAYLQFELLKKGKKKKSNHSSVKVKKK